MAGIGPAICKEEGKRYR